MRFVERHDVAIAAQLRRLVTTENSSAMDASPWLAPRRQFQGSPPKNPQPPCQQRPTLAIVAGAGCKTIGETIFREQIEASGDVAMCMMRQRCVQVATPIRSVDGTLMGEIRALLVRLAPPKLKRTRSLRVWRLTISTRSVIPSNEKRSTETE